MKKLLTGLIWALLPVVLYYGVFIAFEPNNYFGLKQSADGTDIMAALRRYESEPQARVILGDSRTARLNGERVRAVSGKTYANLSYGGASLQEQLDLLDWAMRQNPQLKEVVFSLSFYTLNEHYNPSRNVIGALGNPLAYMTNLGYNINMLTNLYDHISPRRAVGHAGETMDPAAYTYVPYTDPMSGEVVMMREKIAEHIQNLRARSENWQLNTAQLARLLAAIGACLGQGVAFTVVLPPAHDDVMRYVAAAYGIDDGMQLALDALRYSGAKVLDYEFSNRGALADEQYYDGFHLDEERGLGAWTDMLFAQLALPKEVTAQTPAA